MEVIDDLEAGAKAHKALKFSADITNESTIH